MKRKPQSYFLRRLRIGLSPVLPGAGAPKLNPPAALLSLDGAAPKENPPPVPAAGAEPNEKPPAAGAGLLPAPEGGPKLNVEVGLSPAGAALGAPKLKLEPEEG